MLPFVVYLSPRHLRAAAATADPSAAAAAAVFAPQASLPRLLWQTMM
jgi:hypothetical protein